MSMWPQWMGSNVPPRIPIRRLSGMPLCGRLARCRQSMPHRFDELTYAGARCTGDPEERKLQIGRTLLERRDACRVVERVDLGGGDDLRLRGKRRLEQLQLAPHGVEIVRGIAAARTGDVHQVHEHFRALEMPQELMSEPETTVRAFDQSGHVGYDEAAIVAQPDHAEVGGERGERIVGDLRTRGGDARDQRRLAGVWKSDEPDVGEQLELEAQILDLARLAGLHFPRRAVGGRREMRVAEPAAPSPCDEHALSFFGEIGEQARRLALALLVYERADRNRELE